MAENTSIEWAEDTFNPWEGCQETGSPACVPCYARERNLRYAPKGTTQAPNWGPHAPRRRTSASNWAKPLKWNREEETKFAFWRDAVDGGMAGEDDRPPARFVFCASLADVFDNQVPAEWRRDLFELIEATPHLTWLLLTKRPQNIVKLFREITELDQEHDNLADYWPQNAAIGCTVVTQEEADRDVPVLLMAKQILNPAFAFLSMEPLVERVNLTRISTLRWRGAEVLNALTGELSGMFGEPAGSTANIDWVIAGGATRQGKFMAEPTHPAAFESLRDQCAEAGVPFLFKQWGEWRGGRIVQDDRYHGGRGLEFSRGHAVALDEVPANDFHDFGDGYGAWRCGKKHAGRSLEEVTHDGRPEVQAA